MKLPFKIVLINFGAAILFSLFLTLVGSAPSFKKEFLSIFGMVAFFGGLIILIIGLFLLLLNDKRYAQGFILSGGLLMLVGFITCSNITFPIDLR